MEKNNGLFILASVCFYTFLLGLILSIIDYLNFVDFSADRFEIWITIISTLSFFVGSLSIIYLLKTSKSDFNVLKGMLGCFFFPSFLVVLHFARLFLYFGRSDLSILVPQIIILFFLVYFTFTIYRVWKIQTSWKSRQKKALFYQLIILVLFTTPLTYGFVFELLNDYKGIPA